MSSSHFGKKQTTLLISTVFYKSSTNELQKIYYDFVSEYLGHNSIFYQKCFGILIEELKSTLNVDINAFYNVTDGGNHFISRYAFWSIGNYAHHYSTFFY